MSVHIRCSIQGGDCFQLLMDEHCHAQTRPEPGLTQTKEGYFKKLDTY